MDYPDDFSRTLKDSFAAGSAASQSRFINRVFGWMTVGLAVTALTAWFVAEHCRGIIFANRGLFTVLVLAELGVVIALTGAIRRMSAAVAFGGFILYSVLTGVSLSWIFLVYQLNSITQTFCVTSITFGVMGLVGWSTRKDLTGIGGFLLMGLIGIIVASLVNLFLRSSALDFFISIAGVLIFVGLTAYDVQKIRQLAVATAENGTDEENGKKFSILGALTLYLDFINLFLYLLRFFGRRK